MTSAGLSVAARHGDIVAFAGLLPIPGSLPGEIHCGVVSPDSTAGPRGPRTGRRNATTAATRCFKSSAWKPTLKPRQRNSPPSGGDISAERLLDTPFVLIARDASHAAEILAQRHEQFGFDSFTTHQSNLDALGDVIAAI